MEEDSKIIDLLYKREEQALIELFETFPQDLKYYQNTNNGV